MSIDPIGSGTSAAVQQVRHVVGQAGVHGAAVTAAAKAVGITVSQLRAAIARGQSLSSIATAHNVSVATLQSMMASAAMAASPSLGSDQAQHLVQRIIDGSGSAAPGGSVSSSTMGRRGL